MCCKTIAEKANLLKTHVGKFEICHATPSQWIRKFEFAVRSCVNSAETEIDDFFLAYLPYFLNVKHRSWFWKLRKDGESWFEFKKKFVSYFWIKYWNFVEKSMDCEPDEDVSFHEFVTEKVANIKKLMPELKDKAIIMLCIYALPEEIRPYLQEGISESLEMFLSMVEAVDFQFGRKQKLDSEDDEGEERATSTIEIPKESLNVETASQPKNVEQAILEKLEEREAAQLQKMETYINSIFTSPQFLNMIEGIVKKKILFFSPQIAQLIDFKLLCFLLLNLGGITCCRSILSHHSRMD